MIGLNWIKLETRRLVFLFFWVLSSALVGIRDFLSFFAIGFCLH